MKDRSATCIRFIRRILGAALAWSACSVALAQSPDASVDRSIFQGLSPDARARYESLAIRLWDAAAPGARGDSAADVPLLYPVLPDQKSAHPRPVMLVLAGGGYNYHSAAEAFPIAEHFRDAGFAAFVLQYRLRPYTPDASLLDAQRAARLLRSRAADLNLDPQRFALIGFSAGGHLGANLSTNGDDGNAAAQDPVEWAGCRVQSTLLFYPAILRGPIDRGSPGGRELTRLLELDGLHRLVNAKTPPTFLIVGYDDSRVPYEHCLAYATRLHAAGVRFELHVLGAGEHGRDVREGRRPIWGPLASDWLKTCGFIFEP